MCSSDLMVLFRSENAGGRENVKLRIAALLLCLQHSFVKPEQTWMVKAPFESKKYAWVAGTVRLHFYSTLSPCMFSFSIQVHSCRGD